MGMSSTWVLKTENVGYWLSNISTPGGKEHCTGHETIVWVNTLVTSTSYKLCLGGLI